MGYLMYYSAYGREEPARTGSSHATIFPYGAFEAGDGKSVFFGIQNDREWLAFCNVVLRKPPLGTDNRFQGNANRHLHADYLRNQILDSFSQTTAVEIEERLVKAKIAHARLNSVSEFFEHPQLIARQRWQEIGTPHGPVRALLPPYGMVGSMSRKGNCFDNGAPRRHSLKVAEVVLNRR